MRIVSFRYDPLQFAPNFRANFAESGKNFWRIHMKLVRFFVILKNQGAVNDMI